METAADGQETWLVELAQNLIIIHGRYDNFLIINPIDGSYDAWEMKNFLSRYVERDGFPFFSRFLQKVRPAPRFHFSMSGTHSRNTHVRL